MTRILSILAIITFSTLAYADCITTPVTTPDGKTMICRTCCSSPGHCQTVCS